MKKLFLIALAVISFKSIAQNPYNKFQEGGGRVIIEKPDNYKGTNYIYNEWNRGMLVLNDSIFSVQDYIKFDVFNNRVLIKNMKDLNEIIEIYDPSLTGFSLIDSENGLKHDFVKLSNAEVKNEITSNYFEIVFNLENKNYLLKQTQKYLFDPNKSKGVQAINNIPLEYKDKVTYYLKNKFGFYEKVFLNKKQVLSILNGHEAMVKKYLSSTKINFNKEHDVVKFANYYYTL
jgi:hypothetical protein